MWSCLLIKFSIKEKRRTMLQFSNYYLRCLSHRWVAALSCCSLFAECPVLSDSTVQVKIEGLESFATTNLFNICILRQNLNCEVSLHVFCTEKKGENLSETIKSRWS